MHQAKKEKPAWLWGMAPSLLAALLACSPDTAPPDQEDFTAPRDKMLQKDLAGRGIRDERVLAALRKVPRHRFVPAELQERAYDDSALPIGEEQTISQPYIVGIMSELLGFKEGARVLEVGTGSGYQAAVLAELGAKLYTIEILKPLAEQAAARLRDLGYTRISVRWGDGYQGWPEEAPFDAIIVTAAPDHVPEPLVDQLRVGGRMVIPVGRGEQELLLLVKEADGVRREEVIPVRFVPMTGEAQQR